MDLGLKGKGVVVTGASSGIGRAIALEFANEGANLAICARGQEALEKARSELEAKGVEAYAQVCDVSDIAALNKFLHRKIGCQKIGCQVYTIDNMIYKWKEL